MEHFGNKHSIDTPTNLLWPRLVVFSFHALFGFKLCHCPCQLSPGQDGAISRQASPRSSGVLCKNHFSLLLRSVDLCARTSKSFKFHTRLRDDCRNLGEPARGSATKEPACRSAVYQPTQRRCLISKTSIALAGHEHQPAASLIGR